MFGATSGVPTIMPPRSITQLQINRGAKTVSMDLEVKSHKKAKDLHMAGFQR
jgi:hypothetical protein